MMKKDENLSKKKKKKQMVKDDRKNKGDFQKFIIMSIIHRHRGSLLILIILIYIGETPVFWDRDPMYVVDNIYDTKLQKCKRIPGKRFVGITKR